MKKLFKKNWYFIVPYLIFTIIVLALSIIKVPYNLSTPGSVNSVANVIEIDNGFKESGSFNTVAVFSHNKISILKYLLGKTHKSFRVYPASKSYDMNLANQIKSGKIQKEVSINNALISAYTLMGKELNYEYNGKIIDILSIYAPKQLKIGDIITEFNGNKVTTDIDFLKGLKNIPCDENHKEFTMKVVRDNKEIFLNDTFNYKIKDADGLEYFYLGISTYDYYIIDSSNANPNYKIKSSSTLGPSGGLLQALMICSALSNEDITGGLKIAGTGEVTAMGEVGEIGSMYQKIYTAFYNDVDIFFAPIKRNLDGSIDYENSSNYVEAIKAYEDLGKPTNLEIVPVASLKEAYDYLVKRNVEKSL